MAAHGEPRHPPLEKGEPFTSCDRFRKRCRGLTVRKQAVGRVGHKAGCIMEVDWAGPTIGLVDPAASEASKVCLFVARLPFSRPSRVEPDNIKADVKRRPREGEAGYVLDAGFCGEAH